jgi:cell division protease FtsH
VAEELFLNLVSTGASDDFNKATQTARAMVARFGMTDALGPMVYVDDENEASPFGRGFTRAISEATQQKVDAEIRRLLDEQYNLARRLLDENRDKVEAMTAALMEWETIDADQINDIMEGRPPRSPKGVSASDPSSGGSGGSAGAEVRPGSATAPA